MMQERPPGAETVAAVAQRNGGRTDGFEPVSQQEANTRRRRQLQGPANRVGVADSRLGGSKTVPHADRGVRLRGLRLLGGRRASSIQGTLAIQRACRRIQSRQVAGREGWPCAGYLIRLPKWDGCWVLPTPCNSSMS